MFDNFLNMSKYNVTYPGKCDLARHWRVCVGGGVGGEEGLAGKGRGGGGGWLMIKGISITNYSGLLQILAAF